MTDQDTDRPVVKHIERLVREEHKLYGQRKLSDADQQRLRTLELDQCWDCCASGGLGASSEAIPTRRACGRPRSWRTMSNDEAPTETRCVGRRAAGPHDAHS
jgi:Protein of unknown function (DUF2630)